jgi:ABC-2 type transport system ATP-binding protein
MSEIVLNIESLNKRYGKVNALKDMSLEVNRGEVFGLLGPNGSGKTTTLGILLGAINSSSGSFSWFGEGEGHHLRKRIGAILEAPSFYHYLSAAQNLKVVAAVKQAPIHMIDRVLGRVGLASRKDDAFKTYSLGMKQRLAIASALLSDPEVMVLDEPTNGLDPQGIAEIRELILELAEEGRTIILASHLLDEVQRVCSHFAVLSNGVKMYQGSVAELLHAKSRVEIEAPDRAALKTALSNMPAVLTVKESQTHLSITLQEGFDIAALNKALIEEGVVLSHLNQRHESLEQRFLEILKSSPK